MPPENPAASPILKPWEPGTTIWLGVAVFALYFVTQVVVFSIFAVVLFTSSPKADLQHLAESLATNGMAISLALLASTVVGTSLVLAFIKLRKGYTVPEYLSLGPISRKALLISLLVTAALLVLTEAVSALLGQPSETEFMLEAYRTSVPLLLWLATVVFAPVFEEVLFRGFLFTGLQPSRLRTAGTIALTALAWALLHFFQYGAFGIGTLVIVGVALGIMRWKTGSLWAPLIAHSFWNMAAMLEVALQVNGILG